MDPLRVNPRDLQEHPSYSLIGYCILLPGIIRMSAKSFIAFEGIDGSGKTTQARLLAEKLASVGQQVHLTSEPTRGPVGKLIRDIFNHRQEADHRTIAALFVADRLDHLLNHTDDGVLKQLREGKMVITDRYYFSSYAYHSVHVPMDWVIASNALSAEILKADAHIFIDVDPEICMERIKNERTSTELYETLDNLKKVREQYFRAFDLLKDRETVLIIDGNRSVEAIAGEVYSKVTGLIR